MNTAASIIQRGFDVAAAEAHVRAVDSAIVPWLDQISAIEADPRWLLPFDPVDALARAILFQQLSGKAAATIVARVEAMMGSATFLPEAIAALKDEQIRACGVSGNKLLALRDLCARAVSGEVPTAMQMQEMSNRAIIEALTSIRGIGRWTVEMLLIFRLGRSNVLPVDDLGIRKGVQCIDGLENLPSPKALKLRGECWAPYQSYASLALWRIADLASGVKSITKRSQE